MVESAWEVEHFAEESSVDVLCRFMVTLHPSSLVGIF